MSVIPAETTAPARHPARFSRQLLPYLREALDGAPRPWLDPMAGIGSSGIEGLIHGELEPEWADQCPEPRYVGDARHMPFADGSIGAIVTSPAYGNRMADNYKVTDLCALCKGSGADPDRGGKCRRCKGSGKSPRKTYREHLGRPLTEGSTGKMQWGSAYKDAHEAIYAECYRVLMPGGRMIVNVKDHIRKGEVQRVVAWTLMTLGRSGFTFVSATPVVCPSYRYGAHAAKRVEHEYVLRFVR